MYVEVGISRQNYRSSFSPTHSYTFRCLELSRRVRVGTISHQAAVHPKYTIGALNMKEEEEGAEYHGQEGRKTRLYCNGVHFSVEIKVKFTQEQATKAQRWSRGKAQIFL